MDLMVRGDAKSVSSPCGLFAGGVETLLVKKTVFVLGAGSSQSYGYPIGIELSKLMVSELTKEPVTTALRDNLGFGDDAIRIFRDAFYKSGKNSIDAFLEHRSEFIDIGKATTALLLMRYETDDLFGYDGSWLRYLYNLLNTSWADFAKHHLAFITFNYDRSVEHFLFSVLKHSYGKSDDECAAAVAHFPIIHLHGHLGYLPWQDTSAREYGPLITAQTLQLAIEHIKVIHEDTSDRDKDFLRAKKLLAEADQIFIAGFGFNPTNVQRLGLQNVAEKAWATVVNMTPREQAAAQQMCGGTALQLFGGNCLSLLQEKLELE